MSPSFSKIGGLRNMPAPEGVPVEMMSPASSVIAAEMYDKSSGIGKIKWQVFDLCITCEFKRPSIHRLCGSGISSRVVSHGPVGQKVSHDFPRVHCLSANCHFRAETSLSAIYPATYS